MNRASRVVLLLVSLYACRPLVAAESSASGALARYVAAPDSSFGWKQRRSGKLDDTEYTELILTSQTWRDITWKHQLFLIKPAGVPDDCKHALLFITGGNWKDDLDSPPTDARLPGDANLFAAIAKQLKTPVAVLLQVPFQPLFDGKREDALIALTFDKYLSTGDEQWPLLLPMVKSAARAMDATQQFARDTWGLKLETFTVTGASKRGWTTWLTGAVDPRATAIAPMVIDMLNMESQLKHQEESWGKFSEQIADYTQRGIQEKMDTPAGAALRAIVDPYSYRAALTMPKLIMLGTNDRYWTLDALNLYWDGLVGEKYILYIPNNGHGLNDYVRIIGSLNALHQRAARGVALPRLKWEFTDSGDNLSLRVQSDERPSLVRAWTATAATRDFRDATWSSTPAQADGDSFTYDLPIPNTGFAAVFAEAVYNGQSLPLFLSTNVRIIAANGAGK